MTEQDDPRLTGEHIRTVRDQGSEITLVGVVHDHPASVYRAAAVVRERTSDILALELAPMAISLFEEFAQDADVPPTAGGEMSAAIQATETDTIVGIDGPSLPFLRLLLARFRDDPPAMKTILEISSELLIASYRTVRERLVGTLTRRTPLHVERQASRQYSVDQWDDPVSQASDESIQLQRAQAVWASLIPPSGTQLRDQIREDHMVQQLQTLQRQGDVVAIVGHGHLDGLTHQLSAN